MERINKLSEMLKHQICLKNNNILNDEKIAEIISLNNLEIKIIQYYSLNRLNGKRSMRKLRQIIDSIIKINDKESDLKIILNKIENIILQNKILNI